MTASAQVHLLGIAMPHWRMPDWRSCLRAGFPETGSVQEVLFWQTCTIRMMFRIVGDALKEAGLPDRHPGDYLIFLTIGGLACAGRFAQCRRCHASGGRP